MTETNTNHLSWDEWDELHNPPPAVTDFDRVVERAVSRRGFLGGILASVRLLRPWVRSAI